MTKLKGLLLTEGMHGMISQVEGLAKALNLEFIHEKIELNNFWKMIPPKLTPVKDFVFKNDILEKLYEYLNLPIIDKPTIKKTGYENGKFPDRNQFNNIDYTIFFSFKNVGTKNNINKNGTIYIKNSSINKEFTGYPGNEFEVMITGELSKYIREYKNKNKNDHQY